MKKATFYSAIILASLLSSCGFGDKEVVQTEVDFVTVQSTNSIKDDLMKLVEPFECSTIKDKVFVCYPLYIERLDKDNSKRKLDYETNKGVNYDKIAAVKRDFEKFFNKEFSDTLLTSQANKYYSVDDYLTMPNVFIYTSNSVGDKKIGDKKIYSDISELRMDLSTFVSKNKGKVIILFNATNQNDANKSLNMVEIAKKNDASMNDKKQLPQIKTELTTYSEQNKKDYRPLYILAKNSVYMNAEHHESFEFLTEAVEIAYENKQMDLLKQDIGNDLALGKPYAIWKLSTHADDWNPIMTAIANNDISHLKHHDDDH